MDIFQTLVGFVLGILGSYVATSTQPPIPNIWQRRLDERLADAAALREALASRRSLRDELRLACRTLSQNRSLLSDLGEPERQVWLLLSDHEFQDDLADWLMAGGIAEGAPVRERLEQRMERALLLGGAGAEQIVAFKTQYFEALDRAIFSVPLLAAWRHQLSLDYLREQVAAVKLAAEKAAGIFSDEVRQAALERYYGVALRAWDIIDLSNLPEGDIQIATQKLLLRQLYMPLRITVEINRDHADDDAFAALEQRRTARRLREAGRAIAGGQPADAERERVPAGVRLGVAHRLVVLGDPGGGKSTLLRWMATGYLLRLRDDPALGQIPDIETLPDWRRIPVLIRCRELGEADLCRSFADFLGQHLRKTELQPDDAKVMEAVILERIAAGEVLLLVDGLDEITNPQVRVQFCQELERTAARYPDAAIVVTSRIVGYRDMPYRMGGGFEHGTIADLSSEDKDRFAQRWINVTEQHQPAAERELRAQELVAALHSSDRVERLTGNPMLLTTLALVKRKVGKLPSRRNKLYAEAVGVLLNWNPRHYQTIDEAEAVPQLAYIAYEMCRSGVQRLTEEQVLDLLDRIRQEYPNVRPIRQHDPQQFLELLEARSSILIRSGGEWREQRSREAPVWEFRHLTFQEYLAARALIDGRYPGRDRSQTLAEAIAPLAGSLKETSEDSAADEELEVSHSWQEALRLLVADCKDDDVDEVLRAIATPLPEEDAARVERPRLVLAARCLADEPNVGEETARAILARFAAQVSARDGNYPAQTSVNGAAVELGRSIWAEPLKHALMHEFFQRPTDDYSRCGSLWGMVAATTTPQSEPQFVAWLSDLVETLRSEVAEESVAATLTIMYVGFTNRVIAVPGLIDRLLDLLRQPEPLRMAAAWALMWLSEQERERTSAQYVWQPQSDEVQMLIDTLQSPQTTRVWTVRFISKTLGNIRDPRAVDPLAARLDDPDAKVRLTIAETLGKLGDARAVEPLAAWLNDPDANVRLMVAKALEQLGDARAVDPLVARLDDPDANVRRVVAKALEQLGDARAVEPLVARLNDPDIDVRLTIAETLGKLGDARAVDPLVARLDDPDANVRFMVAKALEQLGDLRGLSRLRAWLTSNESGERRAAVYAFAVVRDETVGRLLSRDLNGFGPWLDPAEPITLQRVEQAAQRLEIDTNDVRARYEALASELPLVLEWRTSAGDNVLTIDDGR